MIGESTDLVDGTKSTYWMRRFDKIKATLDNIATNSISIFGVITPPYTDVGPFCRQIIHYLYTKKKEIMLISNEKSTIKFKLFEINGIDYIKKSLGDIFIPYVFNSDDFNYGGTNESCIEIGGMYISHAELITKSELSHLLEIAETKHLFVVYSSPHQLERGLYVPGGLLSDEDALAHFVEPGYVISTPELEFNAHLLPHNVEAIKIIESHVFNHGGGNVDINPHILLNWQEYVRPYLDNKITRLYLKVLFNLFLYEENELLKEKEKSGESVDEKITSWFKSVYLKETPKDGSLSAREIYKDHIGLILRATSIPNSPTPDNFLNELWWYDTTDRALEEYYRKALKSIRYNRLMVLEDGKYNTTPFIREILKNYFRSEITWHRKMMDVLIGVLEEIGDDFDGSDYALELICESINSIRRYHQPVLSGEEHPGLSKGTIQNVGTFEELEEHRKYVYGNRIEDMPPSKLVGETFETILNLLENSNFLYSGSPYYMECLRAFDSIDYKEGEINAEQINKTVSMRVKKLKIRYGIYFQRSQPIEVIRRLTGLKEDYGGIVDLEYKILWAEFMSVTQLSVGNSLIADDVNIDEWTELLDITKYPVPKDSKTGTPMVSHSLLRAYNNFIMNALRHPRKYLFPGKVYVSPQEIDLELEKRAKEIEVVLEKCSGGNSDKINDKSRKYSACELELEMVKVHCKRILGLNRTSINLIPYDHLRHTCPGLYLQALLENIRIHLDNKEIIKARAIYYASSEFIKMNILNAEIDDCMAEYYRLLGRYDKAQFHYIRAIKEYTYEGLSDFSITVKCKLIEMNSELNNYKIIEDIRMELVNLLKSGGIENETLLEYIEKVLSKAYL